MLINHELQADCLVPTTWCDVRLTATPDQLRAHVGILRG